MNIEDFYNGDERRRHSQEVELGDAWTDRDDPDAPYEISWVADTGEVYAMREPRTAVNVITDPFGDMIVRPGEVRSRAMTVEVLGRIATREELERAFKGWQEAMNEPGSVEWAKERARSGAPPVDTGEAPSTEGERTLPSE